MGEERSSSPGNSVYRFGEFELDRTTLELRKGGRKLKLAPQPARVLGLLLSRAGELVSRDEIRRELWGEETFVDFQRNLNFCLSCVRAVLAETARRPRYIETLPRRGYRFVAPVERNRPFAEPTLAVLPFANLNRDPAREHFADGITDALTTELARIKAVRVISRQSVLHLKGSSQKLDGIARELGVDGVVEGTVLHEGDRVRVNAQLILMDPERHVWAQSYECDMSAILSTQREAAEAIAASVAAALSPAPASMPGTPRPGRVAPEVAETFLKARVEFEKMSAEGIAEAVRLLNELAVKAPDFALGLTWYAGCLLALGWWGHAPIGEVYPRAKQLALRAVAIDDSLGEAHQVLGVTTWILDWDPHAAEREFRRAIDLTPSDPYAYLWYATFLGCMGRHSESVAEAQYGLSLSPTSLLTNQAVAWIYLHACRYAEAGALATRAIGSFREALQPHFVLGWAAWRLGHVRQAVTTFERALSLSDEALSLSFLGHIYARLGRRQESMRLLRRLKRRFTQGHATPITLVVIHAGLGDVDTALEWLETSFRQKSDLHYLTEGFPALDPLRQDPRFIELLHRFGVARPQRA